MASIQRPNRPPFFKRPGMDFVYVLLLLVALALVIICIITDLTGGTHTLAWLGASIGTLLIALLLAA